MIRSFCAPSGSMPTKVQMLRMPMPVWLTTVSSLNTVLLKAIGILRMDQEGVGLVAVDHLLRLEDGLAPLLLVDLGALLLGQLVVLGVLVADEVVALVGRARIEQRVDELVGVGALGPADHAPHRGVPLVAAVPDQRGLRLALQRLDVDVEAELAPFLGDQLRGLVGLRQRRLRPGVEVDLADLLVAPFARRPPGEGTRRRAARRPCPSLSVSS